MTLAVVLLLQESFSETLTDTKSELSTSLLLKECTLDNSFTLDRRVSFSKLNYSYSDHWKHYAYQIHA